MMIFCLILEIFTSVKVCPSAAGCTLFFSIAFIINNQTKKKKKKQQQKTYFSYLIKQAETFK